jgi:hypothetical protein
MKHVLGVAAALLAILAWTFGNTIVELESYREANARGLCHVAAADYAGDAQARLQREQCLAGAGSDTGAVQRLLRALRIL